MKTYNQHLTNEDEVVFYEKNLGNEGVYYVGSPAYEYAITDRNDYAVMLSLTVMSKVGCPATKRRFLAA